MNLKYKLTKETKEYGSLKLFQIEATKNFANVTKGEKGGFVEKEGNLSQDGNAWVYGNARVYGNLKLEGGDFYRYKEKSEEIEHLGVDENHELLAREPELGKAEPNKDISNKVKIRLDDGQEVTGTIVENK